MKLNNSKTEFLIMRTPNKLKKVSFDNIKLGQTHINAVLKAKHLGVLYD